MTGDQIINESLLAIGVLYAGQTPSPEAKATSLLALNNLLSEWNAQGKAVWSVLKTTYALTANKGDYTIGPGGELNGPRPEKVEAWAVVSDCGPAGGGKPIDAGTFTAKAFDRSATGTIIQMLNYDPAFPAGNIHMYPKPNGGTLELWVWSQLALITDTTQDYVLPPGYQKAIVYNLAVDLSPKFGRPLDPSVKGIADETKATLGGTNTSEFTRTAAAPAAQA